MGGSQSTRKLTISNNDPTNVIKVSDSVVQRFRGETEAAVSRQQEQPVHPVVPEPITVNPIVPTIRSPVSSLPTYPSYKNEPTITSLQVRQEKEAELRANDQHWQRRITQLEETHEKINQLMEQEFNSAMGEVKGEFLETSALKRSPVCLEGKWAVMQCYKRHPKEPMKCAKEVQAFADCVDKQRSAIVSNRG